MEYSWKNKEKVNIKIQEELSKDLGITNTLSQLLVQKGVFNFEDAKHFFRPNLKDLHDPFLMKDMEKAIERLNLALANGENILIYGDYDVDGTTSVSLVYSFLAQHHKNISFYIPDRYKEGYGISSQSIDYAADNDVTLIIALDCGIKAIEKVSYATKKGIDYIICDHHLPGDEIPQAVAVLDPKQENCNYPYKELSGCGVGFKLLQAYCIANDIDLNELYPFLDLVAISIGADIVHITGENRILAYYGMKQINENPRLGVRKLKEIAGAKNDNNLNISDVVFKIGPRINAAGRIRQATDAVRLLIADDENQAEFICKEINTLNSTRRELDGGITTEALMQIEENGWENKYSTLVYSENWHKGVIGIVASRLTENYYRPTIVLTKSGDKVAGSARSVKGYSVYEAIDACSEHLIQFGGHKAAAGLTMLEDKIEDFRVAFEDYVSKTIREDQKIPTILVDATISLDEVWDEACENKRSYPKFYRVLQQMEPFGPKNENPIFVSENLISVAPPRVVGDDHLKLKVAQKNNQKVCFDAIGFRMANKLPFVELGKTFKLAYHLDKNDWNGIKQVQLRLLDVKSH